MFKSYEILEVTHIMSSNLPQKSQIIKLAISFIDFIKKVILNHVWQTKLSQSIESTLLLTQCCNTYKIQGLLRDIKEENLFHGNIIPVAF